MGGQDQGTYLNIAHQYNRQGGLYYKDYFRVNLSNDLKILYDKYMPYLMPSIGYWDRENSIYDLRFYPLHSVWLAIFENVLGQDKAVYSLTFFSVLTIIAFYLLGYELSGKKKYAGYVSALLVAINPLHVFFSKFPVGEITAVAFTALGFYYLVRYINTIRSSENNRHELVLSLLSFTCFFYTRMSSSMYIPLFFVFATLATLYAQNLKVKRTLLIYFAFLVVSFCISFLYYYKFQPALFQLIYGATIKKVLGQASDIKLAGIFTLASVFILTIYKIKNHQMLRKIKRYLEQNTSIIFLILLIAIFYFSFVAYLSIQLKPSTSPPDFERYWYIGTNFLQKLKYLDLYVVMEYITPVGFVMFIWSVIYYLKNPQKNVLKKSLIVFILWFLLINIRFSGVTRYPYYNTRYLFSESVVYILLLIGVFIGDLAENKNTIKIGYAALISISLISLPSTFFQFQGPEGPHLDFYKNITSVVKKEDLLLTSTGHSTDKPQKYFDNFTTWTIAPLKFYYDLNVFVLPTFEDAYSQPIKELSAKYKNTYLISDKEIPNLGINLITTRHRYSYYNVSEECSLHTYSFLPLESVRTMKIPEYLECLTPPNNYYTRYSNLYMYEITKSLKK
jgi:hypothetical protein